MALGVRRENIVMCDSRGVIRADRAGLSGAKKEFATARDLHTLAEALKDADVFLGLSVADVMTKEMLLSMAPKPIVFALANPDPEIDHDLALATRTDLIFATGRSDFSNQINNVLGFPYIFRGALDCDASEINACGSSHRTRTRHRGSETTLPRQVSDIRPQIHSSEAIRQTPASESFTCCGTGRR